MAKSRRGLGKGKGKGYRNMIGKDPVVHSQSARGMKQPQKVTILKIKDSYKNAKNKVKQLQKENPQKDIELRVPIISPDDEYNIVIKKKQKMVLTRDDVSDALKDAQNFANEQFRNMVGEGDKYAVKDTQSGKSYGLLGLCGFAWIHFKGVKNKNLLEKAGVDVSKSYYGGYDIHRIPINVPDWAREKHPDAGAYYMQSVDIKAKAMEGFLKSLQEKGFLKDAYVDTRID